MPPISLGDVRLIEHAVEDARRKPRPATSTPAPKKTMLWRGWVLSGAPPNGSIVHVEDHEIGDIPTAHW